MFRAFLKALGLFWSLLVLSGASSSVGQDLIQPPVISAIDANGVNLATGEFQLPGLELDIGTQQSGLTRSVKGESDNFTGTMRSVFTPNSVINPNSGQLHYFVSYSGRTYRFFYGNVVNGGSVPPAYSTGPYSAIGGGASLIPGGYNSIGGPIGPFTLLLDDGTRVSYNTSISHSQGSGAVDAITKPDGEVIAINYHMATSGSIQVAKAIKTISSTLGWSFKYGVDANYKINKITAINTSSDYCEFSVSTCPAISSGSPEVTSITVGSVTSIYRNAVLMRSYEAVGNTIHVRTPSNITKTIVVSSTYPKRVQSVTIGSSVWQYSYVVDSSGKLTTTVTAPNNTTRKVEVEDGKIISETDEQNRKIIYEYAGTSTRISKIISPEATYSSGVPNGGYKQYTYTTRGDVEKIEVFPKGGGPALTTTATYTTTCDGAFEKYCRKPLTVTDENGVTTTYTYSSDHGGVLTETLPGVNNALPGQTNLVSPQTRYIYAQITPYIKNSSGGHTAQNPVWRLVSISSCMLQATCDGTEDENKTIFSYGANNANPTYKNVLPVSETKIRGNNTLGKITVIEYDFRGFVTGSTGPKGNVYDKTFTFYDTQGRTVGVIGADPDGIGPRPRLASRTSYNADGQVWEEVSGYTSGTTLSDLNNLTVMDRETNDFSPSNGLPIRAKYFAGTATSPQNISEFKYDNMLRLECEAQRLNTSTYTSLTSTAPNACSLGAAGPDGGD